MGKALSCCFSRGSSGDGARLRAVQASSRRPSIYAVFSQVRNRWMSGSAGLVIGLLDHSEDAADRAGPTPAGRSVAAAQWFDLNTGPMTVGNLLSGTAVALLFLGGLVLFTDVEVGMVRWFNCGPWSSEVSRQEKECR